MHLAPVRPQMMGRLAAVTRRMVSISEAGGDAQSPVVRAVSHHLRQPGLRIRSQIAFLASDCFDVDEPSALALATCCELLHNASLIHDDLHDRDRLRRGAEAVWVLFGNEVALCAGDLLLSAAYAVLVDITDKNPILRLIADVHATVAQTIHGQVASGPSSGEGVDPIAAYQDIAAAKSGPLLTLPFVLVFSYCGRRDLVATTALASRAFAIAYQIADDLADIEADERTAPGAAQNIIIVMERAGGYDRVTAQTRALQMARDKLTEALTLAARLPEGITAIFSGLAGRISDKLDGIL